ncbi:hypothetical protein Tco_1171175, partial [Tanacetum coccineum]
MNDSTHHLSLIYGVFLGRIAGLVGADQGPHPVGNISSAKKLDILQNFAKHRTLTFYLNANLSATCFERLDFLDAMAFNMEYAKWLDGHRLRLGRLQDAVENHLSENEIRFCVDNCMAHIDDFMHLKSM